MSMDLASHLPPTELLRNKSDSEILALVLRIRELRRAPASRPQSAAVQKKLVEKQEKKQTIQSLTAEDIKLLLQALGAAS